VPFPEYLLVNRSNTVLDTVSLIDSIE
jgi:hypothetical protein